VNDKRIKAIRLADIVAKTTKLELSKVENDQLYPGSS
jgi:hypothetical protein